jgi:predicted esterase
MIRSATQQLGFIHKFVPARMVQPEGTLLLLHGTGGNEDDLISLGRNLGPNHNLLSPRGKVLENGFPRYFRRFAEGVFDEEDLRFRTRELAEFVEKASVAYGFDLSRVMAVGFSNGANIAASLLLLFPRLLAGGILFRPMVPVDPDPKPDLTGVSILISSGRIDTIVPRRQPETLAKIYREAGANMTLTWQEAGHGITTEEILQARKWLESALV